MSLAHLTRMRERASDDRALLDALLDAEPFGVLATVSDAGEPWVVPILFARDGDRVLIHGSTGAGALRAAASGRPVAFSVTALDALVVAHTLFESSANYRSAVLRGVMRRLSDADAASALEVLSDRLIPGRVAEVRASNGKELSATMVLELPIEPGSWIYKSRDGDADLPDEETDAWCGIVPREVRWGVPVASPWSLDRPVPASVEGLARP